MNCIKVCGMRDADNIRALEEQAKPDLMGFICWPKSSRFVREVPAYLPRCPRVGVFVNPSLEYVLERTKAFGFSFIQLHGTESPEFCQTVRQKTKQKVIKAISMDPPTPFRGSKEQETKEDSMFNVQCSMFEGYCDLLLFDTKCKTIGGSGLQFNWDILSGYRGEVPFLLSGGIGSEDAERLKQWHHHKCCGFDINSRFETAPGIKDIDKIKNFISTIKQHESN